MRWLLLKDLQILRRSPLQAVLLVAYPVLIAVLVGFAISGSPAKPRVAFLNEVPSDATVSVGSRELPKIGVSDRICERVECVHVKDRAEAEDEVRSGDVLAALILPADLVDRINSLSTPAPSTPEVDVIVNEEDPVKARLVNDRINSLFEATVDATEEAITNAMVAAETMTGANSLRVFALPRDRVVESLRAHGRIVRKP